MHYVDAPSSPAQADAQPSLFEPPCAGLSRQLVPVWNVQLVREGHRAYNGERRIARPEDAAVLFSTYLAGSDREHLVMLGLDTKNGILGIHTVSIGALDRTLVSPREVFKAAILLNAGGIIVGHNHPSGDPDPSIEDRQVANRLHDAGQLLDIELLDSIILGDRGRWVSLKQLGVL